MIQGDPLHGWYWRGPGYQSADEIHPELSSKPYLSVMVNAGPGTNGQPLLPRQRLLWLNGRHTIFGEVADEASKKVTLLLLGNRCTGISPGEGCRHFFNRHQENLILWCWERDPPG